MGVYRVKNALGRIEQIPDPLAADRTATASPPAFTADMASYNDQLIRQTRVYHVQLSMMADSKANMLLTISSILVTLSATHLADARYRWPAIVLIAGCLVSVAFAALTTMPKFFRAGDAPKSALPQAPGFNPLFFGDFTRLSYGDFLKTMEQTMSSASTAYEAQLREIYLLGSFLAKSKYRWLRLGYISFMAGLAGSALVWIVITL